MARPIKATPPIKGADSVRFNKNIALSAKNKVSEETKKKMDDLVSRVLSKSKNF